jgi:WD40 repeat protein
MAVWCVAFSPDGKTVACGTGDRTIRFFDVATGDELLRRQGGGGVSAVAACAPDGKALASACADGTLRVWDAATGKELALREDGAAGEISAMTVLARRRADRDGRGRREDPDLGSGDGEGSGSMGRPGQGRLRRLLARRQAAGLGRGGQAAAALGSRDRHPHREARGIRRSIRCLAFSPDGKTLVAGTGKGFSVFAMP